MIGEFKQNITVIYDITSTDLWNNKIFNFEVASMVDAIPLYLLAEELRKLDYKVMTADAFLKLGNFDGINLMITEIETQFTFPLISHGCIPAICFCGESPLVIPQYYNHLKTKAGKFRHSYLFKGAHISFNSDYHYKHIFYWTNVKNSINNDIPWEQRKFLTLINSNKYSSNPLMIKKVSDLIPWARIVINHIKNWKAFHTFPGNIPDLYNIRLQALLYFCRNKDFDLYGQGWNRSILGTSKKEQLAIRSSYRGNFPRGNENKHEILKKYKYALCFENTVFSGYVTEKIFDCILCGTIPIYFGASDIAEFVPSDIFIDFRNFGSFNELENYLSSLSIEESKRYRDASHEFVNSSLYEKYYSPNWQKSILLALQDVIQERLLNRI